MFFRVLSNFLLNEKKAISIIFFSTVAGTAIIATMLSLSFEIESRIQKELRAFGANIVVEPKVSGLISLAGQPRYLNELDIPKIKTIFWRHNIIGIAPFLETSLEVNVKGQGIKLTGLGTWFEKELPLPDGSFRAGIFSVASWWFIDGRVPKKRECLVGLALAKRLGLKLEDRLRIGNEEFTITGILSTGSREEDMVVMDIEELQRIKNLPHRVSSIWISALTTPMDDFAYKDPATMTPQEYEKWYCTGYVTSIAKQIEEVVRDSSARPVWRVAEAEGNILQRVRLAIYLLSVVTLIASSLGVASTLMTSFLKRTREIGLMKAMGGGRLKISLLLLSGIAVVTTISSIGGFFLSLLLSDFIGLRVFGSGLENRALLLPLSILSGFLMNMAGAMIPLRNVLSVRPAIVLKGAE